MTKETKIRLGVWTASILMVLYAFLAWGGWIQNVFAADTDFAFVPAGAPFTLASTGATGAVGYEWTRQLSAGTWAAWGGATLTATDTLASKAAARYRLRGYVVGWTCDATGCRELGSRTYGDWSDPSDWFIATTVPGCGQATKPVKQ